MEGNEEEIVHSPPTRWIACINIVNYLAYLVHHPSLKDHPLPLGHGHCLAVCHTRPTLPTQFPEPELSEDSGEDEDSDDEEDCCVPRRCNDSSQSSDTDSIDSTSDAECWSTDFTSNKIGIV